MNKTNNISTLLIAVVMLVFATSNAQSYATFPFTDDFTGSGTALGANWGTSFANAAGRAERLNESGSWPQFGTTTDASGTATSGNGLAIYNTSSLASANTIDIKLYANLYSLAGVTVKFSIVDWGTGYYGDYLRVYLSTDGGSTYGATSTLVSLNLAPYNDGFWNNVSLDISSLATSNGLTLSSTSVIKMSFSTKGGGNTTSPKSGTQFIYLDNFKGNYTSILPVELLSFNGKKEKSGNTISWSTASELNNDYFEVEKSFNGTDFSTTQRVGGHGTSNVINEYSISDNESISAYYRLKQVDYDGTTTYSEIIFIENEQQFSIAKTTENTLIVSGKNGGLLGLFDLSGKMVYSYALDKNDFQQTLSLNSAELMHGIYLIKINGGNTSYTEKLIF